MRARREGWRKAVRVPGAPWLDVRTILRRLPKTSFDQSTARVAASQLKQARMFRTAGMEMTDGLR
jgi:hypothetical protein